MSRKWMGWILAGVMCATLTSTAWAAFRVGFSDYGGYTPTKTAYTFIVDESYVAYNKEVERDINYSGTLLAGSDLYIPLGAEDPTSSSGSSSSDSSSSDSSSSGSSSSSSSSSSSRSGSRRFPGIPLATDKQVKNDNVQVSYKVISGADYVDNVTLVSSKKEKLGDLPAGMYAKIEFADTFLPLDRSQVTIRLVLSVNGVSYQTTAVTFNCYLRNRVEEIRRNSVYGALLPMQFRVSSSYYGDATFDFGGGVTYTARVSANKKYYLNLDRTVKENFKEMYPQAYLEFYDFQGVNDTFASTGSLVIPVSKSKFKEKKTSTELYVYEIVGNRLTSLGKDVVSYNHKTNKVTIKTMTLGSYVFSSRPLMRDVSDSSEWDILRTGYAEDDEEEAVSSAK